MHHRTSLHSTLGLRSRYTLGRMVWRTDNRVDGMKIGQPLRQFSFCSALEAGQLQNRLWQIVGDCVLQSSDCTPGGAILKSLKVCSVSRGTACQASSCAARNQPLQPDIEEMGSHMLLASAIAQTLLVFPAIGARSACDAA